LYRKREKLVRKRSLLTSLEYQQIIDYFDVNSTINKKDKSLSWINQYVTDNGYKVSTIPTEDSRTYFTAIIKVKTRELLDNEPPHYVVANISTIENIIRKNHIESSHSGINITYKRIEQNYMLVTKEMIGAYIKRCEECIKKKPITKKQGQYLHPIVSHGIFQHIVIDLIDYSSKPAGPKKEFKYIIHAVDHYSSFHYIDLVRSKTATEVLHFFRRFCSTFGVPCILHTDNGTEFRNSTLESFIENNSIEFRHGKPYKPSTQGKVERGNRTLKTAIEKLILQEHFVMV
jgi:hypothetical protein